jgi:hypothetical protein
MRTFAVPAMGGEWLADRPCEFLIVVELPWPSENTTARFDVALGEVEWREHAALVGSVTLAWNQCVFRLLQIFVHLTGIESPLAEAIFFSHQDRGQRQMIQRIVEGIELDEIHVKSLGKLLKRIEKASPGRNLAAHIIFGVTAFDMTTGGWGPKVVPVLTPSQDKRLEKDFAQQFQKVEKTLWSIAGDLEQWVINTPFPPRSWGHPPLQRSLASEPARHLAEDSDSCADQLLP